MLRNSNYLDSRKVNNATNAEESSAGDSRTRGVSRGRHDLHDVHTERTNNNWPRTFVFTSLSPSTTNITEGASITFTLVTEHIPNGTTLVYEIYTTAGTVMNPADFGGTPTFASFTTTNNSTTLTFSLTAEASPGDAESNKFVLRIYTTPDGTNQDATGIKIQSSEITVTDAVQVGTDIKSAFYEISNRALYTNASADYSGPYDVGEIQQSYTGSARVYIVLKCTTAITYINDICIGAVQILNSSNVVQYTWNFSTYPITPSGQVWQRATRVNGSSGLLSSYLTPAQAAAYSYTNIGTGGNVSYVTYASSTGSTYTGSLDGIGSNSNYPVGNNTVNQSNGTLYMYGEVSGATRYSSVFARSPAYNFSAGDRIRVVHQMMTRTTQSGSMNADDSIWIGIY